MGIKQSVREFYYSLVLHSGLRNWRFAHWLRSMAAVIVAPTDVRAAQRKCASDPALSNREKALLSQISLQIHPNDEMYVPFDALQYLTVGLSAMRCVEAAVGKSNGNELVHSIMDFPCGHGRVLRFLRARFPDAAISACEINKNALEFCKDNFRVNTVISKTDFSRLSVPGRFDLIWCGSLLTHVDENSAAMLLKFFHEHLSPGGKCLFTTHGRSVVDTIRDTHNAYGLCDPVRRELLSQFDACGYGYGDYANSPGFGVSVVAPDRMLSIARSVGSWRDLSFLERAWNNHQDVYIGELA